jgi:uncharacterized membrane protein
MTMKQILDEYKKQFIIVMETVGEIIKTIPSYKNVEKIIERKVGNNEEQLIDVNAPFGVFVVLYISLLLADIHGAEVVASWENVTERKECRAIYNNYLKEITDNFTRKYGLEKVDLDRIKFIFKVVNDDE